MTVDREVHLPTFPIWKIGTLTNDGLEATIRVNSAVFCSCFLLSFITHVLQAYFPPYACSIRLKVRRRLPNDNSRLMGIPEISLVSNS